MDPNFTFPRPQPPKTRPVVESANIAPTSRESNALRASVLDAALMLGVGSNSMVTDWMFNNPLEEEEEEENTISPALTYASTATSEESVNNTASAHRSAGAYRCDTKPFVGYLPQQQDNHTTFEEAIESNTTLVLSSTREINNPLPRSTSPGGGFGRNKLKKRRTDGYGTGYESEGYTSEGAVGRKKTEKKKKKEKVKEGKLADAQKKMKVKEERERAKEEKKADKKLGIKSVDSYDTDGGYLSESPELSKFRISRSKSKPPKSNTKPPEHTYETDSGYVSSTSKQKRSFFRLASKSSKTDLTPTVSRGIDRHVEVPPMPPMPLPIAEMFSSTSASSAIGSRVGTPTLSLAVGSGTVRPSPSTGLSSTTSGSGTFSTGPEIPFTPGSGVPPAASIYSPGPTAGTSAHSTQRSQDSDEGKDQMEQLRRKGSKLNDSEGENGSFNVRTPAALKIKPAHPTISLPLTRPVSPPVSDTRPIPGSLFLGPGSATGQVTSSTHSSPSSPLPSSPFPSSPFVLVTPVSTSPPKVSDHANTRPTRASQLSIIPSANYIVPSPNPSPTLPSVLAYYDLPPPSPPPSGPLPRPPQIPTSLSRSRSPNPPARVPNTTTNANSPRVQESTLFNQPIPTIQRGRETPFPTRPVLPQMSTNGAVSPGFEARLRVRRYRDLYPIHSPGKTGAASQVEVPSDDESDDDEEDMRDLLDRFVEEVGDHGDGRALPTRRSFEDLRDFDGGDDDKSTYPREEAAAQPRVMRDDARFSKYSASPSIYSRGSVLIDGDRRSHGSFLDGERSEAARERFVQRVEAMFDETGREKTRVAVPPVPRLPAGVVNQRWGRF